MINDKQEVGGQVVGKTPPQMRDKKWMIWEVAVGHLHHSGQVEGTLGGTVLCV